MRNFEQTTICAEGTHIDPEFPCVSAANQNDSNCNLMGKQNQDPVSELHKNNANKEDHCCRNNMCLAIFQHLAQPIF